ncbi:TIGR03620 family F420-dependent LLM class oxidoreductase [Mycobacterium sp. MBM]|nr:TIGR03620 family F420-dependent LLM class oxidoreductase [Mycobacterium sp. MBM]
MELGHYGFAVEPTDPDAQQIADLGFGTLWVNGGQIDRLDVLTDLLTGTQRVHVAPAIIPPDLYRPADIVDLYRRAEAGTPGRLLIGLGSSQQQPLAALTDYIDQLAPIPRDRRLLAAFGPHKLDIARDRFAGAMPGMVTPEYTAAARMRLGVQAILAVGQFAMLDTDADAARHTARVPLGFLMTMPSYVNSARRQGFSGRDIEALGDRLVDAFVAWGTADEIIARADQHLDSGADHVYLSVLSDGIQPQGLPAAELLAPLLRR